MAGRNRAEACGAQSSPGDWLRVENRRETLPYGDRPLILCTEKPRPLERGDPLLEPRPCFRSWLQGFKPEPTYEDLGILLIFSKKTTNSVHP